MIRFTLPILCLFLIVCSFFGCSKGGIPVIAVTGEVTYNGQPLAEAMVMFVSQTEGVRNASAITDSQGRFELTTAGAKDKGAMSGSFMVLVTKIIEVDKSGKPVIHARESNVEAPSTGISTGKPIYKSLIPERYGKRDQAEFSAVVEKGKNHFTFALQD